MTFEQLLGEIKKRNFYPVYFLHGAEPYFIDKVSELIEKTVLTEGERSFNQVVLYGKDTDHLAVLDNARRYPMMASHQVILLKEAQDMKTLKDLQTYLEQPMPTTILVICYKHKRFNMSTAFGKILKAKALVFEAKSLYDNQVPDWIVKYLKNKKLSISSAAAELIAEYMGTDLSAIVNGLEKLVINLPPGSEITEQHIEEHIGISKDYNVFELQKALAQRDVLKANRIVNYFSANARKNPLVVIISALYSYFSKVYMLHFLKNASESDLLKSLQLRSAYFLREYRAAARTYPLAKTEQILGLLKDFDLKSKGVNYNSTGKPEGELLKELVWRILH